jgi:hypothetical protein
MPRRLRSLIGTVLLIVLVVVWAFLAMFFAELFIVRAPGIWQGVYYVLVGLGWVLPAGALIWWMSRPRPTDAR